MAELKPYNPTIRDRIASALMGEARPGSARANMVEGITGSRGIGPVGMGLIDFTPAGIPLAGQEAQRSAQSGDMLGATLNAMAVIPAAKAPVRAAQQGIKAYHGSPHDFDAFSLSKIGTGEGGQAYGHGLYFAEAEPVAREYRDKLSRQVSFDGGSVSNMHPSDSPTAAAVHSISKNVADGIDPIEAMKREAEQWAKSAAPYLQFAKDNPQHAERAMQQARSFQNVADEILRLDPSKFSKNSGRMYEVNIRANPNDFLDWDKPLGQQPTHVQSVIRALASQMPEPLKGPAVRNRQAILAGDTSVPGDVLYNNLGGVKMPEATSKALLDAGIPGIKYLDQGSRTVGEGSRNYVVFDDKLIDIVRKYGLAGLMAGGLGAYGATGGQPPQAYQPAPPKL